MRCVLKIAASCIAANGSTSSGGWHVAPWSANITFAGEKQQTRVPNQKVPKGLSAQIGKPDQYVVCSGCYQFLDKADSGLGGGKVDAGRVAEAKELDKRNNECRAGGKRACPQGDEGLIALLRAVPVVPVDNSDDEDENADPQRPIAEQEADIFGDAFGADDHLGLGEHQPPLAKAGRSDADEWNELQMPLGETVPGAPHEHVTAVGAARCDAALELLPVGLAEGEALVDESGEAGAVGAGGAAGGLDAREAALEWRRVELDEMEKSLAEREAAMDARAAAREAAMDAREAEREEREAREARELTDAHVSFEDVISRLIAEMAADEHAGPAMLARAAANRAA